MSKTVTDLLKEVENHYAQQIKNTMFIQFNAADISSGAKEETESVISHLDQLYDEFSAPFEDTIQAPSYFDSAKNGVLAAGTGIAAGVIVNYAINNMLPIPEAVVPGKSIVATGVSLAIGAAVAKVFYNIWPGISGQQSKPAMESEAFQKALQDSGLLNINKTFINKLIKLFYFREALLFGAQHEVDKNMRKTFKRKLREKKINIDSNSLNTHIESYFLQKLSNFVNEEFQSIYHQKDQHIDAAKNANPLIRGFKQWFSSEDQRSFTQELQIEVLKGYGQFLMSQSSKTGILATHPYLTASVAGLLAGAIALSAVATLGVSVGFSLLAIAVTLAVSMVASYFAVTRIEELRYVRKDKHRESLERISENINEEAARLKENISQVVGTSKQDIEKLHEYYKHCDGIGYRLADSQKADILLGSCKSWINEYAARYRHNQQIEIDLGEKLIKPIAENAQRQVNRIVKDLKNQNYRNLNDLIDKTRTYLNGNMDLKSQFCLQAKIKDQLLEISSLSAGYDLHQSLQSLTVFYQELGGNINDLSQIRALSADKLQQEAQKINIAYEQQSGESQRNYILKGDNSYRSLLNLSAYDENLGLDAQNIDRYLNDSVAFLFSLLDKPDQGMSSLEQPLVYSNRFTIYHMLLLKQLTHFIHPSNKAMDELTKSKIRIFIKEKLLIDDSLLLRNSLSDSLITEGDNALESVAESLRHHLANTSTLYTPKTLLIKALGKQDRNSVFGLHDQTINLVPETTDTYLKSLDRISASTLAFINQIQGDLIIQGTGIFDQYVHHVKAEVQGVIECINKRLSDSNPAELLLEQQKILIDAAAKLNDFIDQLSAKSKSFESSTIYLSFKSRFHDSSSSDDYLSCNSGN